MSTSTLKSTKRKRTASGELVNDTWSTPLEVVTAIERIFGFGFHLDICATKQNTKCTYYVDRKTNALGATHWSELYLNAGGRLHEDEELNVFCNPGYSNVLPWCERANYERTDSNANVFILAHDNFCGPWFREAVMTAHAIYLLYPRIQFIAPKGVKQSTNSRCSTLLWFAPCTPRVRYTSAEIRFINWRLGNTY